MSEGAYGEKARDKGRGGGRGNHAKRGACSKTRKIAWQTAIARGGGGWNQVGAAGRMETKWGEECIAGIARDAAGGKRLLPSRREEARKGWGEK